MTRPNMTMVAAVLVSFAHAVAAQTPPRPNESPRAVTLSLTEYNRLIDLASRPPQSPAIAPVAAVLASADLRVRVERETARGVFNLTGEVLRSGLNRVSLLSGATLVDASAAGRPLPLLVEGTAHTALLPGPGPFALTLEWGAPLTFAPGRASFVLPVPPAGTARVTIDLPGEQAGVHLSAGLITRQATVDGRTMVEATLSPGSSTEVWWSMRDSAPAAAARDVRMLAEVMTLVTLGDSDVRMVALVDVTVVQGEPRTIAVKLPSGYELTSISGSSLETSDAGGQRDGTVVLTVGDPAARRHQFLVSLERPHDGGSFTLDTGFPSLPDVQRERGEIAIEGVGTLELSAADRDGMHRIDVRELNQALQSLSRLPILSAFRYQRSAVPAGLALDAKRFTDAGVLAAFADFAVATTLVTAEGRALTEVLLQVQNRAQAFLRVTLPPGASIVSADVAGEAAKPVLGADGTRVPLLRPGFRPKGPYTVSFVYLNTGTPFARKGDMSMRLPKMDMPVGIVEWEVFVPDSYSVRAVDGNVIERSAMDRELRVGRVESSRYGASGGVVMPPAANALPGQIRGRTTDRGGAALAGVTIMLDAGGSSQTAITRSDGTFVLSGVPSGPLTVTAQLAGFALASRSFVFDQQPRQLDFTMSVGQVAETVTVTGESPKVAEAQKQLQPSQNVISLQRRAAGVLPIRIDVPRAGTSHQFVKPLVVDQETVVNFRYKRR
ncbi:MAG: hypothetical protein DMF95_21955 [Acidobacteria bacterium]|nr:MAG: hypothetical protein DMF95_21955 [Acidobacteriota bacterium]